MSEKIKVLIVDDNLAVRESLVEYLAEFGLKVVGAGSAQQSIDLCRETSFQVAIVDMNLPDMGGRELIPELHRILPELKFFLYTGSPDFELSQELCDIGMDETDVIFKPIRNIRAVVDAIEEKANAHCS